MVEMKDIKGYEKMYAATKDGRIWSYRTKDFMAQYPSKEGYKAVNFTINYKHKRCRVHRLIAETWLENPDNLPLVKHKDGDITNNNVDNLYWSDYNEFEVNERCTPGHGTPVYCVELNTAYPTIGDASLDTGANSSSITAACQGIYKTAGGYHWWYI